MVLPLHDAGASMSSLSTFTEFSFQFRVAPTILGAGLAFGVVMGAAGGLLPAWNAARKEALAALRAVA
jgi:ABC-type antimicrobial peptide transport system permease subunit